MQSYNSTDMAAAWKNFHFILSERSDFYTDVNQSISIHALPTYMLTLLSVDEILPPRYVNWSTNFSGLPFNEEMAPS